MVAHAKSLLMDEGDELDKIDRQRLLVYEDAAGTKYYSLAMTPMCCCIMKLARKAILFFSFPNVEHDDSFNCR